MNDETRQILESLQFLVSMKSPGSERYQEKMASIMSKNHLLLNPIEEPHYTETLKQPFAEDVNVSDEVVK